MNIAIIVAAGQGRRMGASRRKQFLHLDHQPILTHTLKAFDDCRELDRIVLVVPDDEMNFCDEQIIKPACLTTPIEMIAGERRRQDSVFNGLNAIKAKEAVVLIHDGVRPLVSAALVSACVAGAEKWGACVPAIPVVDTLKQADQDGCIQRTVDRSRLYAVQTPQAFKLSVIMAAHEACRNAVGQATDDAALVEAMGQPVHIVPGERENIKITTPEDLVLARTYLQARSQA